MKDRLTICEHYIARHECKKGRNADFRGYCQHCDLYERKKGAVPALINKKRKERYEYHD